MIEDVVKELEQLEEDNKELYDLLQRSGYSRSETLNYLRQIQNEREDYLKATAGISVRKELELPEIMKVVNFHSLTFNQQNKLLWELGFNTLDFPFNIFLKVVREGPKARVTTVVVGQERLDNTWMRKRDENGVPFASIEARDTNRQNWRGRDE